MTGDTNFVLAMNSSNTCFLFADSFSALLNCRQELQLTGVLPSRWREQTIFLFRMLYSFSSSFFVEESAIFSIEERSSSRGSENDPRKALALADFIPASCSITRSLCFRPAYCL